MLFYSVTAAFAEKHDELSREEKRKAAYEIQAKTEIYLNNAKSDSILTVSEVYYHKHVVSLCIVCKSTKISKEEISDYLRYINFTPIDIELREITIDSYRKLLCLAEKNDYVDDEFGLCSSLGILEFGNNRRYHDLSETIILKTYTKTQAIKKLDDFLCDDNYKEEIERIYIGSQSQVFKGHPAHYLVTYDDTELNKKMVDLLIDALQINNRVASRRYVELFINLSSETSQFYINSLYNCSEDATVVIKLDIAHESDSKDFQYLAQTIINITNVMKIYRNKVLTVFCLNNKFEKCQTLINDNLGDITLVHLSQGSAFNTRAKNYLKRMAKENSIDCDRELLAKVKKDRAYSATDLNEIFDDWYNKMLKEKVYSQYSQFKNANKNTLVKKVKGSAIKELDSMIGLSEAKQTIHSALDFYKAQKVFKSKGFIADRPAMHMVFTGNPGTAKTTVARHFAQIMKDNGLLSVGDLYEVGRADLVGKYVGWTAKIVKEKFAAARGSVLFIDEAYSLVDDKSGMYGDEAINTIVQEMENYRDNMIVIFAGYPDKMEEFMARNPGLKSRIAFHVPFEDYSAEELFEITNFIAKKNEISLDETVNNKLLPIFEKAVNTEDFGNGRFARNLFEKAIMKQSSRLIAMDLDEVTKSDVTTLVAEDFEIPTDLSNKSDRKIGF